MVKKLLIPLISALVIIGGIVASLYTELWSPSWNPFVKPDKILEESLKKMADLKTYSQEVESSVSTSDLKVPRLENLKNITFSIETNTDLDLSFPENPKSSGDFKMEISVAGIPRKELKPPLVFFLQEGKLTFPLKVQMKQIGKEYYLKIKEIPPVFNLLFLKPFLQTDVSGIMDNWIKIDPEAISKWTGVKYEGLGIEKRKKIQEEIGNILKGRKILSVKKVLENEKIDNVISYHYLISVNSKEFKEVISEIENRILKEYLTEKGIPEEELEKNYKEIDKIWEKLGGIEFEIWIEKQNKFIRKISLEKELNLEKFVEEGEKISGKVNVRYNVLYSNLNQPISITAPQKYKNLEEILEPALMRFQKPSGSAIPLSPPVPIE